MKSALRRALAIADEIESFALTYTDDPEGIYCSVNHVRELAIRLSAVARSLDHPYLREALKRLQIDIDGNNFDAGVALDAELKGIAGWLRDATEEWGEDPSRWLSPQGAIAGGSRGSRDEKPLHTKERDSLLKLVIGMAKSGYAYDQSAAKSHVPGEIVLDLDKLGLKIDVGTVRKYLKEGLDLLPSAISEHDS